jgi:hypothetical protein
MATESDMDKKALADNIQRTVERAALRNIRTLSERLQEEQKVERRLEKRALIIALLVVSVFGLLLVLTLVSNDEKFDRGQPVAVPDKIIVPHNTRSGPD